MSKTWKRVKCRCECSNTWISANRTFFSLSFHCPSFTLSPSLFLSHPLSLSPSLSLSFFFFFFGGGCCWGQEAPPSRPVCVCSLPLLSVSFSPLSLSLLLIKCIELERPAGPIQKPAAKITQQQTIETLLISSACGYVFISCGSWRHRYLRSTSLLSLWNEGASLLSGNKEPRVFSAVNRTSL